KISWVRIAADPASCDEAKLTAVVRAIQEFEVASTQLLREQPGVRHDVFAGVRVNGDPRLPDLYLDPPTDRFSIDRPDLHIAPDGVFASEVDEMPGGFPELVHVDRAYGVNQDRWKRCFDWLFSKGPLLFLVSSEWSKCYIPETSWLVEYLRSLGYPVYLRMTDDLEDVEVDSDGVRLDHDNVDIGTIWRQFPIFETTGKLVDLVAAARMGHVRMVPEFGHWGNKVWFSLFRKHGAFFRRALGADVFATLNAVLPDSHLIRSANDFPFSVAQGDGVALVSCLQDLRTLPMQVRDRLVLKACGASNVTARSKGVRMGNGIDPREWQRDIDECLARGTPFI
ncbi:MAG: hypothetical protein Q8R16_04925, partial [bacterium]|nr:hypothetical protein [bacterium]